MDEVQDRVGEWSALGQVVVLVALLALSACATVSGSSSSWNPKNEGVEIRSENDPDYDVLVAGLHEQEGRSQQALAAYERAAAKDPDSAYLQRKLAEGMARENRLDEALQHAEGALELEPDDVPTRVFLARVYRLRRAFDKAEAVLVDASGFPVSAMAGPILYQILMETDRAERALEVADWMLEHGLEPQRARIAKAGAYQRLGRIPEAEGVFREALELDPGNPRIAAALARSYRERGEGGAEIALYEQILEIHPHHHLTLIALAEAHMSQNDLERSIATFEEIERHYPEDLRSLVRLGLLKFEARKWDEAGERFSRFLEGQPEEYDVVYFLGRVHRRAGEEQKAIETFKSIPQDHKNYSDARTELAAIYERRGDYDAALDEIARAADKSPSRALDLYSAHLRAKAGDFDGAVARLEGMLLEEPGNDELLYNLGVVYGEAKLVDESIEYMQRALRENPDNASALNYVGYTWAERGMKLDKAQEMIERALELRPNDGYITDSLGWVYYMRAHALLESGRRAEAQPHIERALRELERADELTGGDPVISEHLGDIYLLQGERARALERFERAVEQEPRLNEQPELFEKLESLQRELH